MQLTCQHCQAAWEFSDRRPAFCPFCGKSLPPDATTELLPATAPAASEAETQACPPSPSTDAADPETVGGYRLLRVIGGGGMGKVYEAEDMVTGRRVALKLVSADYAGSADAVERFRQEGRLASLISHPRCVFVLAADEQAGRPYIVMELMPGDSLDDYVRRNGPQRPTKAVHMILDVIEGLQEAHRVGVVHRDVKPSNCFFGSDGRLKVGDFGLSKSLAQGAHLTKTGSFLGTPMYASPEQVRGEAVDAQTDVYSVAATLYFVLTGQAPFQSDNAAVTLARIAADPAPSMRKLRPELSPMLDAVVLRALERDRKRRWHNLDDLAEALRQFLPGRSSLINLAVRFAAIVLDWVVISVLNFPVSLLAYSLAGVDLTKRHGMEVYHSPWMLLGPAVWVLYFGLSEGLWGASAGKWVVSLRVRDAITGKVPGLARGLWRALISYFFVSLGTLVVIFVVLPLKGMPPEPPPNDPLAIFAPDYLLLMLLPLVGMIVGIGLMVSTMRARNGYRGVHEFLSGTCVVSPLRRRPWALTVPPPSQSPSHVSGIPEKIGAFNIRAAYRWDDRAKVLLGFDAVLGRQTVLWLRPAEQPPMSAQRRELNRTTRLRWVSAGRFEHYQWDAFVAPGGSPLPTLVQVNGRLQWPQVQPFLKQLTDELLQALKEDTLPQPLAVELACIQADGRAVLLDMPFTEPPEGEAETTAADEISEKQALALLARVALLALEGHRVNELPVAVRAPLPLPAAAVLGKLLTFERTGFRLRDLAERLTDLQDKPPEVTRGRRAGQLALMLLALNLCLGCCLSPFASLFRFSMWLGMANLQIAIQDQAIEDLDEAFLTDWLPASRLDPSAINRVSAVSSLEEDRRLRGQLEASIKQTHLELDERVKWGGAMYKAGVTQNQQMFASQRAAIREAHRAQAGHDPRRLRQWAKTQADIRMAQEVESTIYTFMDSTGFFLGPVLWVLWAFVTRAGLSYLATGIAVVRRDGKVAGRFRCAWRAFLVWIPIGVMILLSLRLEDWYWSQWRTGGDPVWAMWTAIVLMWTAWLLLGAYLILALRYPSRSPLDWLTGAYLVPAR
jgi:hypothetical protein